MSMSMYKYNIRMGNTKRFVHANHIAMALAMYYQYVPIPEEDKLCEPVFFAEGESRNYTPCIEGIANVVKLTCHTGKFRTFGVYHWDEKSARELLANNAPPESYFISKVEQIEMDTYGSHFPVCECNEFSAGWLQLILNDPKHKMFRTSTGLHTLPSREYERILPNCSNIEGILAENKKSLAENKKSEETRWVYEFAVGVSGTARAVAINLDEAISILDHTVTVNDLINIKVFGHVQKSGKSCAIHKYRKMTFSIAKIQGYEGSIRTHKMRLVYEGKPYYYPVYGENIDLLYAMLLGRIALKDIPKGFNPAKEISKALKEVRLYTIDIGEVCLKIPATSETQAAKFISDYVGKPATYEVLSEKEYVWGETKATRVDEFTLGVVDDENV